MSVGNYPIGLQANLFIYSGLAIAIEKSFFFACSFINLKLRELILLLEIEHELPRSHFDIIRSNVSKVSLSI